MSERKEFFEVNLNLDLLEEYSTSSDSSLRWAAAIELGQVGSEQAISLLWSLTTDSDENVRDAANLGLQQSDQSLVGKVLASKWQAPTEVENEKTSSVRRYLAWKVRPLEVPSVENGWAVDAAVLNIIQIEGPMTGSRLMKLYGNAAYPNNPKKLPKSKILSAIKRLEARNLVKKIVQDENQEVEYWTLHISNKPPVDIRDQGPRKLTEIPVTEVIARLQSNLGDEFEHTNQDQRVKAIMSIYGIKKSELHLLGNVLAKEWSDLLKI